LKDLDSFRMMVEKGVNVLEICLIEAKALERKLS